MLYLAGNYNMITTAAPAPVTTGTAIKTMMQLKTTLSFRICEWGWSFNGSAAATPGLIELVETGSVFGTVTAYTAGAVTMLDAEALLATDPITSGTLITAGTSAAGFTCTSEGSITATRQLAGPQQGAPTTQFIQQFPLGQEPLVQAGNACRIRATFGTAVTMFCYIKFYF